MDRATVEAKMTDLLVDGSGSIAQDQDERQIRGRPRGGFARSGRTPHGTRDTFGVAIPDEEAEAIATVGQAVDVVMQKLAG